MKSIMLSLSPYWYYLISEGIKKIEVRKTVPTDSDWNKQVECYMTKDKKSFARIPKDEQEKYRAHFGKVGMQFVGDRFYEIENKGNGFYVDKDIALTNHIARESCLQFDDLRNYFQDKDGYAWHISNLKIYDKPKELGEFSIRKKCTSCKRSGYESTACMYDEDCVVPVPLTRPPQSWCYVEELSE